MNIYTTAFIANCPNNGARIHYVLTIKSEVMIEVEQISDEVALLDRGFHEEFADQLFRSFGGEQELVAEHHGVNVKTIRK